MIALALLLAAAAPSQSAVDAERAFATLAQTTGQWTAFRHYAADEAVMFVPETVNAQAYLKDLRDPPSPVMWWPAQSFVSCDGNMAVNTGPWVRQGGKSVGYFTTVWQRQADGGWKWLLDHGDGLTKARRTGERASVRKASCRRAPPAAEAATARRSEAGTESGSGTSPDGSLRWSWTVREDGARTFSAALWNGRRHVEVLKNEVAAPAR